MAGSTGLFGVQEWPEHADDIPSVVLEELCELLFLMVCIFEMAVTKLLEHLRTVSVGGV